MDAETRDRTLHLAGVELRGLNPNQLRDPRNGRWIDTGALEKIRALVARAIKGSTTRTDWRGVHITAPVNGRDVTVTISPLDVASLALLFVPGAQGAGAAATTARTALLVSRVRRGLAAASAAQTVAGAVSTSRRSAEDRGQPYPGQRYTHGWVPVAAVVDATKEILSTAELDRDYGDELDRVEIGDVCVVARPDAVTIERDAGPDRYEVLASPGPSTAAEWADHIEETDVGTTSTTDGLVVDHQPDGVVSLRFPTADDEGATVDLAADDVDPFVQALRDTSYTAQDAVNAPDDEIDEDPEAVGDETPLPDKPAMRHRELLLLGFDLRAAKLPERIAKGYEGGGRFKSATTRLIALLKDWDGTGDPLATLSQPQLRKAAEELGLNPPKGMRLVPLKALIIAEHRRRPGGLEAAQAARVHSKETAPDLTGANGLSDPEALRDALDLRTVNQLKAMLRERGLPVSGRKRELVDRLVDGGGVGPKGEAPRKAAPAKAARTPATPVPIRDLFDADDATIETALKDVFEGKFGPYTTKASVSVRRAGTRTDSRGRVHEVKPSIGVEGKIYDAQGHEIGNFGRSISPVDLHYQDGTVRREMWAEHEFVQLGGGDYVDAPTRYHGKGFGGAFNRRAIDWYRDSGVHGISQKDYNGYVWASQGFNFSGGIVPDYLVANIRQLIADIRAGKRTSDATKDEYHTIPKRFRDAPDVDAQITAAEALLARLATTKPGEPGYPTAYEISQLGRRPGQRGKTALWLGKLLWVSADEMILNPDEGEVLSR